MSKKELEPLHPIKENYELDLDDKDGPSNDTGSEKKEKITAARSISVGGPLSPLIKAIRRGSSSTSLFFHEMNLNDSDIKATDQFQRNVFHYAVSKPDILRNILEQLKTKRLVLEALNQADNEGETPIHRAATIGNVESLEVLHKYDNSLMYLKTTREERSVLHLAVKSRSVVSARFLLNEEPDLLHCVDNMSQSPVHYAASLKQTRILELFISKGCNTTEKDSNGQLPIHIAASKGQPSAVGLLLQEDPAVIDAVDNLKQSPIVLAVKNGYPNVVSYLLSKNANYKLKDKVGLAAFDWAVKRTLPDIIKVFLNVDGWKELVIESYYGPEGCLTEMIENMPDLANMLLDKCITTKGTKGTQGYQVKYDFFCLETKATSDSCPRFFALEEMTGKACESCLRHPVSVKYVDMKWRKRGFKYVLTLLLFTFLFHICLMIYTTRVIGVVNKRTETRHEHGKNVTKHITTRDGKRPDAPDMMALRVLILSLTAINIFKEAIQIMVQRLIYFKNPRHYYRLAVCITVLFYLLPVHKAIKPEQIGYGAVAVFLSWLNLMQLLKFIPVLGIYIILVQKVFWTLIEIFCVVLIYLLSFASTFYILLAEHDSFRNIHVSFVSTFVAMFDGIDYDGLFVEYGWYPAIYELKMVILVLFILAMPIVVNNTLIGLAVGDTNEVMKSASFDKYLRRARFVIHLERGLNKIPYLKSLEDEFLTEFPEQEKNAFEKILDLLYFGSKIDAVDGESAEDEHEHELEIELDDRIEKAIEAKLENLHSNLRNELKAIQDQVREDLEEKVGKILEKLN